MISSEGEGCADVTTTDSRATDLAAWAVGFIVGEGCFTTSGRRFKLSVGLGATDRRSCELLRAFFAVGNVYWYRRRKDHYDDEATFVVQSMRDLVEVIVPFMDAHLPPSYKRQQYLAWRAGLLDYWENKAKRQRNRTCSEPDCDKPERAKGLCRSHYYQQYRR